MFDRLTVMDARSPSHVTQTVHEHKAPTDESVKLLMEMQNKVMANLLGQIRVENNGFEIVAYAFNDVSKFEKKVCIKYKIGTVEHTVDVSFRYTATVREMANKLVDELARDLAKNLLQPALTSEVTRTLLAGSPERF